MRGSRAGRLRGDGARLALAAAFAVTATVCLWTASRAEGYVYWGQWEFGSGVGGHNSVGRVDDDGLNASPEFVTGAGSGPCAVAVDDTYIYWSNWNAQSIGRATLDASVVDPSFIPGLPEEACGIAVNGTHIFWANTGAGASGTTIGRANLDGTSPNQSFVTGLNGPCGVAVDSNFIYYGNNGTNQIGRAPLGGGAGNNGFITGAASFPCGVAVNSTHIYWANSFTGSSIGRANLNGSSPNQNLVTGAPGACGVALDSTHIYWANTQGNELGSANLDGSSPTQDFVFGNFDIDGPCGVATTYVAPPPTPPTPPTPPSPPPNSFKVKAVKKKPKFGRATLVIKVPGAGVLQISGKGVVSRKVRTGKAGKFKVRVKTKGKLTKTLDDKGLVRVRLSLGFTPDDGTESKQRKRVTVLKSRKG